MHTRVEFTLWNKQTIDADFSSFEKFHLHADVIEKSGVDSQKTLGCTVTDEKGLLLLNPSFLRFNTLI